MSLLSTGALEQTALDRAPRVGTSDEQGANPPSSAVARVHLPTIPCQCFQPHPHQLDSPSGLHDKNVVNSLLMCVANKAF